MGDSDSDRDPSIPDDPEDSRDSSQSQSSIKINFSVQTALDGTYFKRIGETSLPITGETIQVKCQKCGPEVPQRTTNINTSARSNSNLFGHMKRHHSSELANEFKNYLTTKRENFATTNPSRISETRLKRDVPLQSQFDNLLVDFIIRGMVPLKIVDDPSFKNIFDFLHIQRNGLNIISRRTLCRRIDENYSAHVAGIKKTLGEVPWLCTTADIWSGGKRSFIGVTAHWIGNEYQRKSVALACRRFKGSHTYDRIASILHDIHVDYGLDTGRIVATVTDNGSNFAKSFEVFGVRRSNISVPEDELGHHAFEDDEEEADDWVAIGDPGQTNQLLPSTHLRCAAHTLALCASSDVPKAIRNHPDLLNVHSSVIEKCNCIWRASRRPKTAEVLEDIIFKQLKRPVETRWNSLYDALKDIAGIESYADQLKEQLNIPSFLTSEEFEYLNEFITCSRPVADAIDILQGEKQAYYGQLVPTLLAMRKKLQKLEGQRFKFCRPVAQCFLESVEKRFSQFLNFDTPEGEDAAIAALSFPKFKKKWFPCVPPLLQTRLVAKFKTLILDQLTEADGSQPMETDEREDDFYDFGKDTSSTVESNSVCRDRVETIMLQYFTDRQTTCDMLKGYPSIIPIFQKFNTPVPSSAQVERLFSYATMTNMPLNNRLTDEKFEKRVLLKANTYT